MIQILNIKNILLNTVMVFALAVISLFAMAPSADAAVETRSGLLITSGGEAAINLGLGNGILVLEGIDAKGYPLRTHIGWGVKVQGSFRSEQVTNIRAIVLTEGGGDTIFGELTLMDEVLNQEPTGGDEAELDVLDTFEGRIIVRSMQPAMDISPQKLFGVFDEIHLFGVSQIAGPAVASKKLIEMSGAQIKAEGKLDGLNFNVYRLWVENTLVYDRKFQ